jgi:hypothetical protein
MLQAVRNAAAAQHICSMLLPTCLLQVMLLPVAASACMQWCPASAPGLQTFSTEVLLLLPRQELLLLKCC